MDVGAPGKDTLRDELITSQEEPKVTVRFHISEGEQVFIRHIRIEGLTKTKDLVVRRELSIYPGERVNTEKFAETERALRHTGYFDPADPRPVEIYLEPDQMRGCSDT